MRGKLVNLNVNPCKMCMPMGAVTALYGIRKCMSILHGSQGCSTYIRRHMATHYNEPVDIASTSLTEEGTVYGGEKNLIQGLLNLIQVYEPEVIGVSTTCLAETIGEDLPRMIERFYTDYPEYKQIAIIPVSSAGYSGTQYEGFMKALCQIVRSIPMDVIKHNRVNIVTSQLSPADTRYLKALLGNFNIDYILLPDLSENLDGGYRTIYQKLPEGGTSISDISQMAGARMTIELSSFVKESDSVGRFLYETYGVPYRTCNLPISLRDNDELIELLTVLSGGEASTEYDKERSRYLDAMIDAHNYSSEVLAAIFGEPDFTYSMVRFCVENGILPVITATGTKCPGWREKIEKELKDITARYQVEHYVTLEDTDFGTIEEYARELKANVLIGNSDGRRIAHKLGIRLVRRSFPIHDHLGGQRLRSLGYVGALTLLDEITNTIIDDKEENFRVQLYEKYYKDMEEDDPITVTEIQDKTQTHPCYNCKAHKYARMHLPIAPKCNISCNYCVRKYDCPNESRPGVTTSILTPEEALARFLQVKEKVANLTVVGIAGPGDALANFEETKRTLELIRQQDQKITFCLSTNGLMLPHYAQELVALGVSHVTVTMNAIDPAIGARIYKYVDYLGQRYVGEAAAAILLSNQLAGIRLLTSQGVVCKINIVMLKGINDSHIPEVVKKAKELGATMTNILPMIPVMGSTFEKLEPAGEEELRQMRKQCGETLTQMYHCRQCRADAIGMLGEDQSQGFTALTKKKNVIESELQIAVATKSGMMVDQHFGHASEFYVYQYRNGNAVFKEKRSVKRYCNGQEECNSNSSEDKMESIIATISDCNAVIAMRIGDAPTRRLNREGILTFTACDGIEMSIYEAVKKIR
ncbi:MAG: nifB [Herbinix sp.]|jgi:nitrogenase molybdenum-iron protein alpha/beta subunit/MoaA/NifB/PqqE/SkfB family radical SAM enzyme|nr:nifB [Herbinix sp.]